MIDPDETRSLLHVRAKHTEATIATVQQYAKKIERLHDLYAGDHADWFRGNEAVLEKARDAFLHKFLLTSIHLQELWTVDEAKRWEALTLADQSLAASTWDDRDAVVAQVAFESFLFQARSLIDVFFVYSTTLLGDLKVVMMSRKTFFSRLENHVLSECKDRGADLRDYVESSVLGEGSWGGLVRGLRDKIAHLDCLRPTTRQTDTVAGVALEGPTIARMPLTALAQSVQNGAFGLIADTTELLFERPWKAGPYRPDMW